MDNAYSSVIAQEIVNTRFGLNMSLRKFVEVFNRTYPKTVTINPVSLSRYERGENVPKADVYLKIRNMQPNKRPEK